ncbi:nickel/cobalt ABC transporter permease [Leminorella grimontii]|uniref:nickel/cobalt ABC transporter permease n=1 Tax=Leminorella grimontii TaxID=82981 RepID=UPI0032208DB5
MRFYLIRRLIMTVPLAVMISFLAFVLMSLAPSDPAEVALRVNAVVPTDQAIALMRHELGLDKPFLLRYLSWLWNALHLDFGTSFVTRTPVLHEFLNALPATLWLAGVALLMIVTLSLALGVGCALAEGSWLDKAVRSLVFLAVAVPNYWIGLLLIWWLSVKMDWFPVGGMSEAKSVVLPALTLTLGYIGTYFRLIRGGMVGNLHQNYALYARARGLSPRVIVFKHVLVNSLHSSLTAIGMSIPKLIAGTVVIENVFAWPGIGRLCVTAIFNRDYPVIQAYVLLMAALFLLFNFLVDVLQIKLDPRLLGRRGR